jgi:hypothetical protein
MYTLFFRFIFANYHVIDSPRTRRYECQVDTIQFDSPSIIRLRGPTSKRHTSHFQLPMRLNCTVQRHVTTQTVWDNEERHIAESREINKLTSFFS